MAAFLSGAGPLPQVLLLPPSWSTDGDSLLSEQEGFESPLRVLVVLPQSPLLWTGLWLFRVLCCFPAHMSAGR